MYDEARRGAITILDASVSAKETRGARRTASLANWNTLAKTRSVLSQLFLRQMRLSGGALAENWREFHCCHVTPG
jgi:hypothetical protein